MVRPARFQQLLALKGAIERAGKVRGKAGGQPGRQGALAARPSRLFAGTFEVVWDRIEAKCAFCWLSTLALHSPVATPQMSRWLNVRLMAPGWLGGKKERCVSMRSEASQ